MQMLAPPDRFDRRNLIRSPGATAIAAFFVFLLLLIPGCQNSCNQPAPSAPPPPVASPSTNPTEAPTVTPTATPTPLPYAMRNFPCLSNTLVGKEFEYAPGDQQEVHLISAKLGEDSKLIAHANHISRFTLVQHGRSVHIDNQHIAPCDISDGLETMSGRTVR